MIHNGNDIPPDEDNNGRADDDHDIMTASNQDGTLHVSGNTCDDWTSVTATPGPAEGHMWPRGGGGAPNWIMEHPDVPSCAPGDGIDGNNSGQSVGARGGYGGIYCFALNE